MRTPFTYEAWIEVLKKENAELKEALQALAEMKHGLSETASIIDPTPEIQAEAERLFVAIGARELWDIEVHTTPGTADEPTQYDYQISFDEDKLLEILAQALTSARQAALEEAEAICWKYYNAGDMAAQEIRSLIDAKPSTKGGSA